jgi:hypothetical protein
MVDYNKIIKNEGNLIQFLYSYNWDDGFKIPYKILDEKECTLQVALLIFEFADGFSYMENKGEGLELPEWSMFISGLYNRILNGEFKKSECVYYPDLTRVQIYKLKKLLSEEEYVFITPINIDNQGLTSESDNTVTNPTVDLCRDCVRKNLEIPKKGICRMCGENTLTEELQGASIYLHCGNCGYEVVAASFFPPCHDDEELYTITVLSNDIKKENKPRIAKCFGLGVMELSKELSEKNHLETKVKLDIAERILVVLKDMSIPFSVTPQIIEKYPDLSGCKFR